MENFIKKCENNSILLNSISAEDWIKLLKNIVASCLSFAKEEEVKAILEATDITIKYGGVGLEKITIVTSRFPSYENYKIELSIIDITISQQQGHSAFECLHRIPISTIRVLLESKLKTSKV